MVCRHRLIIVFMTLPAKIKEILIKIDFLNFILPYQFILTLALKTNFVKAQQQGSRVFILFDDLRWKRGKINLKNIYKIRKQNY